MLVACTTDFWSIHAAARSTISWTPKRRKEMYSRLFIQTRLTPGQVNEVLQKLVRPRQSFFHELHNPGQWFPDSGPQFIGWVENNRFKFHRVITGRNSFLPIISGKVIPAEGGAVLQVRLRLALPVAIFMTFWMTMTIYAAIETLPRAVQGSNVMGAVLALGMPLFGVALTVFGFFPEKRRAVRLLTEAFGSNHV